MSQTQMLDAVYDKLVSNTSLNTSVGGRFFRDPPQEPAFPLCIFNVVTDVPDRYFGASDISAEIQISFYGAKGSGEAALQALAADCIADLDGARFTMAGHFAAEMVCQDRGIPLIIDQYPQVVMRWNVYASES